MWMPKKLYENRSLFEKCNRSFERLHDVSVRNYSMSFLSQVSFVIFMDLVMLCFCLFFLCLLFEPDVPLDERIFGLAFVLPPIIWFTNDFRLYNLTFRPTFFVFEDRFEIFPYWRFLRYVRVPLKTLEPDGLLIDIVHISSFTSWEQKRLGRSWSLDPFHFRALTRPKGPRFFCSAKIPYGTKDFNVKDFELTPVQFLEAMKQTVVADRLPELFNFQTLFTKVADPNYQRFFKKQLDGERLPRGEDIVIDLFRYLKKDLVSQFKAFSEKNLTENETEKQLFLEFLQSLKPEVT